MGKFQSIKIDAFTHKIPPNTWIFIGKTGKLWLAVYYLSYPSDKISWRDNVVYIKKNNALSETEMQNLNIEQFLMIVSIQCNHLNISPKEELWC